MTQSTGKCPTCKLGHNPDHFLCPKCNKSEFRAAVKDGLNPFDHMRAGRIVVIALLAFLLPILAPSIALIVGFTYLLMQGRLDLYLSETVDIEAMIEANLPSLQTVSMFIGQILAVLAILIVARKYLGAILAGFRNYKAVLMSAFIITIVFFLSMGWGTLIEALSISSANENQAMVEQELIKLPVVSFISTAFLAPLLEEVTFRCGVFGLLRRKNLTAAFLVSTILFTLIHLNFAASNLTVELFSVPSYLLAGFALSYIYHKYGFVGSFVAHAFNNAAACILIFAGL